MTWAGRRTPGRWPSGPGPSPRPPTAPTTPPSPSAGEISPRSWAASGTFMMASQVAPRDASPMAVVLGLLRADAPGQIVGAPRDWPRWAVLLPHVLAATGHL